MRCPSALLAARTACVSRQRAVRARTARVGRAALPGGGPGGPRVRAVGWRAASARTAHLRATLPSWSSVERKGFLDLRPGSSGPQPGSWGPNPGTAGPPRSSAVQGVQGPEGARGQGVGKGQGVRRGRSMMHAMPCGNRGMPEGGERAGGEREYAFDPRRRWGAP